MIARGFKPVAWVAAIGTAALGCYMLSLQVAAERSDLMGLERRIVSAQQDIRALQTELGTRGRLQQLEQWNSEVLALSAPAAGQFLSSNVSLARFDVRAGAPAVEQPVRMASAEAPGAGAPAAQPQVRMASIRTPAASAPPVAPPPVTLASAPAPAATEVRPQPPVRRAGLEARSAAVRPAAAPMRPASLLDDGTLRDLRAASRSERVGTRN